MGSNLDSLAKHASQMDMEEIERKINLEISIPKDLMTEIQAILNNNMAKAEKLKKELELR